MTDEERDELINKLGSWYPRKMSGAQIADFADRFAAYEYRDVYGALVAHRDEKRFVPSIAEIVQRLKGKVVNPEAEKQRTDTLAGVIRHIHGERYTHAPDFEVLLRFYRWQCWRYRMGWRGVLESGNEAAKAAAAAEIAKYVQCQKKHAATAIISETISREVAIRAAEFIDGNEAQFDVMLQDLKGDPFAAPAACPF